jgi:hypothetical protein
MFLSIADYLHELSVTPTVRKTCNRNANWLVRIGHDTAEEFSESDLRRFGINHNLMHRSVRVMEEAITLRSSSESDFRVLMFVIVIKSL